MDAEEALELKKDTAKRKLFALKEKLDYKALCENVQKRMHDNPERTGMEFAKYGSAFLEASEADTAERRAFFEAERRAFHEAFEADDAERRRSEALESACLAYEVATDTSDDFKEEADGACTGDNVPIVD